jgi:IPT/TIG domain
VGPTKVMANITIHPTAVIGPRDITAANSTKISFPCSGCFEITVAPLSLFSITPPSAKRNTSGVSLTIIGTGFTEQTQVKVKGRGVSEIQQTFVDSNTIMLTLQISSSASVGFHKVKAKSPGEKKASRKDLFQVTQ